MSNVWHWCTRLFLHNCTYVDLDVGMYDNGRISYSNNRDITITGTYSVESNSNTITELTFFCYENSFVTLVVKVLKGTYVIITIIYLWD